MSHFAYACKTERQNGISRLISELLHTLDSSLRNRLFDVTEWRFPNPLIMQTCKYFVLSCLNRHVSFRLRMQNAVSAQPCVGKAFESYPCYTSEMIRNTLNHCLKFTLHSIFCHICYGKISKKNVNPFFKVKLFISKTSDSCFQGFDFFQMLLASHRY